MTDTHRASQDAAPAATESTPAGPSARKGEARNFQSDGGSAPATNLEAVTPASSPPAAAAEFSEAVHELFAPMISAQMEANRWFDKLWRQSTGLGSATPLRAARPFASGLASAFGGPAADLKETDLAYELSVELPGLTRSDVDLTLTEDMIRVTGHKAESRETARADYRISERRFGRFERNFPIPPEVRRDAIAASFENGVLKIAMPKTETAAPQGRRVEIG